MELSVNLHGKLIKRPNKDYKNTLNMFKRKKKKQRFTIDVFFFFLHKYLHESNYRSWNVLSINPRKMHYALESSTG